MQAVLDAGRGTLTLPRRLVPVVMLLGTRRQVGHDPSTLRDLVELERAGIAPGRRLHPLAADILRVVTGPRRVITIEVTAGDSTEISTIWSCGDDAVLGQPAGSGLFQLGPIETTLLPFHLAALTRVGPRPDPPFSGSVTVPAEIMDELDPTWFIDLDGAVQRLVSEGIDAEWAERIALAHRHRLTRWRVASLWSTPDGSAHDDEILMLDAGHAGYWQVLAETGPVGHITFETRRFVDVMEALQAASPPEG